MIRLLVVTALAAFVAGCGGDSSSPAVAPAPSPSAASSAPVGRDSPEAKAPVLVTFIQQRPHALLDKITVHTNGYGLFDRPSGGVGRVLREVEITPGAMRRLRADFSDVPRRLHDGKGRQPANPATYIIRFGGRTVVARQGLEPAPLKRSIHLLANMVLTGAHVTEVTSERLGGVAGATHLAGVGKPKKPRQVVFFQRQGAAGATLDTFTVFADGSARHEKRYGGAGGRFKDVELKRGQLAKLRRELAALPRGSSITRGSPPPGGAQYLIRYRGRTITGRAGAIASEARPAVKRLDGYIDGIGVGKPTNETATHAG